MVSAKVIINCAGLYGDEIERLIRQNCDVKKTIRNQGSFTSPSPSPENGSPSGHSLSLSRSLDLSLPHWLYLSVFV
jgi:hypothetical protein